MVLLCLNRIVLIVTLRKSFGVAFELYYVITKLKNIYYTYHKYLDKYSRTNTVEPWCSLFAIYQTF